jgi:hypothetical protein
MASIVRGWALVRQGGEGHDEEMEEMRLGLAGHRGTGAEVLCPHFMALLAEASIENGRLREGFCQLEEALLVADSRGERCYQDELYRIKGEVILGQGSSRGLSRRQRAEWSYWRVSRAFLAMPRRAFVAPSRSHTKRGQVLGVALGD